MCYPSMLGWALVPFCLKAKSDIAFQYAQLDLKGNFHICIFFAFKIWRVKKLRLRLGGKETKMYSHKALECLFRYF